MAKTEKFIIEFDTETTGLHNDSDQIIQAGFTVENSKGEVVEEREYFVKLKDGVIPSPYALTKNRLNPFSKEWAQNSITESQLVEEMAAVALKYNSAVIEAKREGKPTPVIGSPEFNQGKPVVSAYNAPFDKGFLAIAMARNGKRVSDYISKSWINPINTAKKLIAAGKLKTKETEYGKGSAALTAVAEALDIKYDGTGAHTALSDAKVLAQVRKALFRQATGFNMNEVFADPADYEPGKVYHIISDSASSGVKTRHIHVLKNDPDKAQIIALDEDDIKKNGELRDSAIRTFNYDTIVGEKSVDNLSETSLNAYIKTRKGEIDTWLQAAVVKFKKTGSNEVFDEDTRNFDLISGISDRMVQARDKREALTECYADLLAKFNGDKINAKTVLTKAELLAQSRGFKGWSKEIYPEKTVPVIMHDVGGNQLRVALHPSGFYKVGLDYLKDGEVYNLTHKAKDTREIKKLLAEVGIDAGDFKEFLANLPSPKEFKDNKNAEVLEAELKKALDYLSANPNDAQVKNAVGGVLKLLKKEAPAVYNKYRDIPVADYQENYFATPETSRVTEHTPMTAEQARIEYGATPSDHLKPGDKAGKSPCALCGRALSAELSKQFSMGPTCRQKAEAVDSSEEPIESFVQELTQYSDLKRPLRPGEIAALQMKRKDGKVQTIFSETLEVHDDHLRVLNRREFKKSLKAGYDPAMCVVLNTIKVPIDSILGVGRIDPEKIGAAKGIA